MTEERSHRFEAAGEGTRECPRYLRCVDCGFCRPLMSDHGNLGCADGLREFYGAVERSEKFHR